jgi:M6 family metalloprotease-like protein
MTSRKERPRRAPRITRAAVAVAAVLLAASFAASARADIPPDAANHPLLQPIDAQSWVDQAELTWADYTQIRPSGWHTDAVPGSVSQFRGAVVLAEFTDQPFLISQVAGSHPFGNPQPGWEPVEDVRQWMHDYLTRPGEHNGGQTIHGYWMEDSHGKLGVSIDTFGPYLLPGKLHEYGIPDGSFNAPREQFCPQGDSCNKSLRTDSNAAWRAAIGCPGTVISNCGYDFVFYVSAAHDESSTWQEFGEMLYESRDDIPAAFGPPRDAEGNPPLNQLGNPMPNWADTRYVDWTSWRAAANHWPNASVNPPRSSTQAESSGQSVYAHEFSHILGLPDNYNNPFADNERNFTGYWEMMSRGTFNGPGGTHNRWQVPNQGGSGLGPHHMLHFKNQLGVLAAGDQLTLERNTLHEQGVAVVRIKARSAVPGGGALSGLTVNFGAGNDLAGTCANQGFTGPDVFYCPNRVGGSYLHYRLEVVDRVGNDSFAPGHGVLISKSRNSSTPRVWLIDPRREDIGMIDFYRPDGTPVPVVRGDPRQLNDATFHAGTRSGSEYEYKDDFNRLHFYVLAKHRDAGVLSYDVGVRRFDGAGGFTRGVALGNPAKTARRPGFLASCTFPLRNTGAAGTGVFDSDIYRVAASSSSPDWKVTLPNALAAAKADQTVQVPVHVLRDPLTDDGDARTVVTLTATSETDPTKTASRTCNVHVRDTTPAG